MMMMMMMMDLGLTMRQPFVEYASKWYTVNSYYINFAYLE